MCGYQLAERLRPDGITLNAVHPGLVGTSIIDDIAPRVFRPFLGLVRQSLLTPEQGAASTLHLATAAQLLGVTGGYYEGIHQRRSPAISYDRNLQHRAWAASEVLTGATPQRP